MTTVAELDAGLAPGNPWASVSMAGQGLSLYQARTVDRTDGPGYVLGMAEPAGEKVSIGRVLEILKEAGDTGITGPEIARHFTYGALQRRLTVVNQVLYRMRQHQRVIRGPKEPTKYYHRVPTYRWFITAAGVHYLAVGMREGIRQARLDQEERERAVLAAHRRRLADLLTDAYDKYDPQATPRCERERVMRELRAAGCTLHDIGEVVGLTRERVRQILDGYRVSPCKCTRCHIARLAPAGHGET